MRYLRAFGRFWYGFIVGDDWRVAAGVALALLLTWLLTRTDVNAWWLMPAAVAGLLWLSLAGEVKRAAPPDETRAISAGRAPTDPAASSPPGRTP